AEYAELQHTLDQARADARHTLDQISSAHAVEIASANAALDQARQTHAGDAAAIERLTRREAELVNTLTDTTAAVNTLEQRFASADLSPHEREPELVSTLADTTAAVNTLEQRLASAELSHEEAAQRHASELATAAARLAERGAEYAELQRTLDQARADA